MLRKYFDLFSYHFYKPFALGPRSYSVKGVIANRMALDFSHETYLVPVLRRIMDASPGAIVDIGVNVGQTFLKVIAIDPERRYVGFDPQIDCCFFVSKFIKDNNIKSATVLPMALSEHNGLMMLHSSRSCDELASLVGPSDETPPAHQRVDWVNCRRGDEVLEELGLDRIAAVKIDVEGAELQVLRGLTQTIAKHRPSILFEQLPNFEGIERARRPSQACTANTRNAQELMNQLTALGYAVHQINSRGEETEVRTFDLDDAGRFISSDFVAHPR